MVLKQLTLFDDFFASEPQKPSTVAMVASVVFGQMPKGEFDYLVPKHLQGVLEPGQRVRVPLGKSNRLQIGYCVSVTHKSCVTSELKAIHSIVDEQRLLSPAMLQVTRWIAEHYLCDWGQVLETVLPKCVRENVGLRKVFKYRLAHPKDGLQHAGRLTAKQQRVLEILASADGPLTAEDLVAKAGCSSAVLGNLVKRGLIEREISHVRDKTISYDRPPRAESLTLNSEQRAALQTIVDAIRSGTHKTILIHGVTGSGKTEVYIQAIEEVVRRGCQAIVLVPEISLTPQTVERFRSRFHNVAVLHSHLTDAERAAQWEWIASGAVEVVVGARSAVFSPTPRLGLIILDEEHESSFKQESAPRYHAREVAEQRARIEGIPLVLGSATPSLESWYRAQQGEAILVQLPRRIANLPLPDVKTIDLREPKRARETRGVITRQLHAAIEEVLKDGGQVILLLNRRGFATHVQCPSCGVVLRCPHCDISLTHHKIANRVVCHYCDYEVETPRTCPQCDSPRIRFSGTGTERLEAEIKARFPHATCLRMDADSMRSRLAYERAFAEFRRGRIQILVGTQIIAKGLDFPNVRLVGVVNADTALHFPDFRASERTFQLVTQVAGRTGRGPHGGQVLVQTFTPEHPAIQAAIRHDYETFAQQELKVREAFGYPPFWRLARIVVSSNSSETAEACSREFAASVHTQAEVAGLTDKIRIVGPAPAPLAKLRGKYRYHLQVMARDYPQLLSVISTAQKTCRAPSGVTWTIDVDPIDML
ncbi:MAG: primosomal protein N' [Thermogutta sp.]|nr:primosomal protein N' [Thermogutta sp.]